MNCKIVGNVALDGGGGGGSYLGGDIMDCDISGNRTGFSFDVGGGLASCTAAITRCTISGNSSDLCGGLGGCGGTISDSIIRAE
ncbi:hypothetical protein J7M28_04075 [bacterium]|nr:hypothetical protein [bacterium]